MMMPKIIAHRGASGHAPENTMAAFQLAYDQQADGIELDVMLSKDHNVVVIHDDTVERTTNGFGRVRDKTLAELRSLDAGNGEKIPTLVEVLERFGGRFLINIELKNYSTIFDSLPLAVAEIINSFDVDESLLISSFNPFNLPRIKRKKPGLPVGLITDPGWARRWIWRFFQYDALHPYFSDVDAQLVKSLHGRGKQVNVWDPDEADEIYRLAALGVDGIITNCPMRAREVLESRL